MVIDHLRTRKLTSGSEMVSRANLNQNLHIHIASNLGRHGCVRVRAGPFERQSIEVVDRDRLAKVPWRKA